MIPVKEMRKRSLFSVSGAESAPACSFGDVTRSAPYFTQSTLLFAGIGAYPRSECMQIPLCAEQL